MARYLDPKNDVVFKRIFGEHPDLLISFLNALMPLPAGQRIERVEYLTPELVPETPMKKFSVVDVRCCDSGGRQFIVEMQMEWSSAFPNRMLHNASRVYGFQLNSGEAFDAPKPVYALGILNQNFDHQTEEFYHHYQMANRQNTDEVVEGIELILVELRKFTPERWADKKMAVLWLRFLRELNNETTTISADLLASAEISRAVAICNESAYSERERATYEHSRDATLKEVMFLQASFKEGKAEGEWEKAVSVVLNGDKQGLPTATLAAITGLTEVQVADILKEKKLLA
jgi:predicted transposase/invertase (TIGR01784 family)